MADSGRLQGERVFCHQCSNEWDRAQGGLQCPNCESEFTEVLEGPRSPSPETRSPPPIPPNRPFHNHDPWQDDIPDPDEDDITTYQWNSQGGNGTFTFTSRTLVSGGGRMNGRNVDDDPALRDLVQNFGGLLTHIIGPQNGRNNPPIPQVGGGFFPFMGQSPPGFGQPLRGFGLPIVDQDGILRPRDRGNIPEQQVGNIQDMLGMIFGALSQPAGGRARGSNQAPDLATLIAGFIGAPNGRAGDAVFTQEAFDQVMSQLMEQNQGSTAPPPATEEAIDALPKKKVTPDMMGNDGKVECSICMDDVELGAEVTVLPCDHWFHHECIKHWLKEHDTCPHCRKPIEDHDAQPPSPNSRRNRSSTSRRPSSVASPRAPPPGDGSRINPFTVPDSPSSVRERRQQYFGSGQVYDSGDMDRRRSHRSTSAQSTSRLSAGRQSNSSNNAGGAMSWMRSHMPFGS